MAREEIVFLPAVALGAPETAHNQHCYAGRNQNGENASMHRDPMPQVLHLRSPIPQDDPVVQDESTRKKDSAGQELDLDPSPIVTTNAFS